MFSYGSVFELLICQLRNGVFNLLLGYWANYIQGKTKLCGKSENAVVDDQILKFCVWRRLTHVESSVRCHRKYKNDCI